MPIAFRCDSLKRQFQVSSEDARRVRPDNGSETNTDADAELMAAVQSLRYQVYCEEYGFLPASDYPDGRETDRFDAHSTHFCAHDHSGQLVGYVRLVGPDEVGRFPFEHHGCVIRHPERLPDPPSCAEISRLMVSSHYRRRRGDVLAGVQTDAGGHSAVDRRLASPKILLSMYRKMYQFSLSNGIRYWYAAMETPLARSLLRLDFVFHRIGPLTDYYGPVAPYLADLRELERLGDISNPALWQWLRESDAGTPAESDQYGRF